MHKVKKKKTFGSLEFHTLWILHGKRDSQTDRDTERHRHRQTDGQTERQRETYRRTKTGRERDHSVSPCPIPIKYYSLTADGRII